MSSSDLIMVQPMEFLIPNRYSLLARVLSASCAFSQTLAASTPTYCLVAALMEPWQGYRAQWPLKLIY